MARSARGYEAVAVGGLVTAVAWATAHPAVWVLAVIFAFWCAVAAVLR